MFEQVEVNSERWLDLKPLKNEIWKDVKNWEKYYSISNYGRIKNKGYQIITNNNHKQTFKPKIYKATKDASGYYGIRSTGKNPFNNFKKETLRIHRLVVENFLENKNNYNYVNHKDGNKANNCVENLEWCTNEYNIKEAWKMGLCNKRKKKINQYDLKGNFIRSYESAREAERIGGFRNQNIANCLKGRQNTHYNYIWKYSNDIN